MAKKAVEKREELEDMLVEAEEPKAVNLSEPKSGGISIQKYLQLHGSKIHMYTRAYLREQFRGIILSKDEWEKRIKEELGEK